MLAFPFVYKVKVAEKTNLVKGSFLFPLWRDLPLPIYKRIFFFNITNADDFLKNGVPMQVEEVGPYTYNGVWIKEDLKWYSEGIVSYRQKKTFEFVPEKSVGSETDEIYTLNAPYIIASDVVSEAGPRVKRASNKIFNFLGEKLIIKKTIGELAFGGYKDPVMRYGKYFRWDSPYRSGTFAWLHGRNNSDDGVFDVFTGVTDHGLLNIIHRWNGDVDLDFWKGETCNMINGTNGEFGPPLEVDQTEYTFFQPIFCRSLTFRYGGIKNHRGIETRRFESKADIFSKENPDNYCFDVDPELKSGVLDVGPCQFGAPVVLSFPHFYLADDSFLESTHGLSPNKDEHGSHIDVEPVSGVTVDLSIKLQMNLKVKPVKYLSAFQNATSGVYPVFWLDLLVELPEHLLDTIDYQLFRPKRIVHITLSFVLAIATAIYLLTVVLLDSSSSSEEKKPLLRKGEQIKKCFLGELGSYNEFKPGLLTSTPAGSIENFNGAEKSVSFASPLTALISDTVYDSCSAEESDVDKHVDIERAKLWTKRSFKKARTLTVL